MSLNERPNGTWEVRWRVDGKQRSKTFRTEEGALQFEAGLTPEQEKSPTVKGFDAAAASVHELREPEALPDPATVAQRAGVPLPIAMRWVRRAENVAELDYLLAYGEPRDNAAQRKALALNKVPVRFVSLLVAEIDESGIPLAETAKGWADPELRARFGVVPGTSPHDKLVPSGPGAPKG